MPSKTSTIVAEQNEEAAVAYDASAGIVALAEWEEADESSYTASWDAAWSLGADYVAFYNATNESQRAYVRAMGIDDKKNATIVDRVRKAVVVAMKATEAVMKRYDKAVPGVGDRSVTDLVRFIEKKGKWAPKPTTAPPAELPKAKLQQVTVAEAQIKAILALLDPEVKAAVLAHIK